MRTARTWVCLTMALGCQKTSADPSVPPAPALAAMGVPEARVGSAAFHLEIAGVYERYGDPRTAIDHLQQAAALDEEPGRRVQAWSSMGRLKELAGDKDGAIEALERALAVMDAHPSRPAGDAAATGGAGSPESGVLLRLSRLQANRGDSSRARLLCERGLSSFPQPWERERFYHLLVELDRKEGTLEGEIAAREKTLEGSPPDEGSLRFLAAALGGESGVPAAMGGGPPQARSSTLLRVYQRLHEIRPEDAEVRQRLQGMLQSAGRADEAAVLSARPSPDPAPSAQR